MAMVMGAASASADEVTLTKTDGAASGLVWTSTTVPATTITLSGGGFLEYDEGIGINVAGATRTVTIATTAGYCHVTGYSMTVTGYSGDGVIITAGDQTLTTDASDQVFTVSGIAEGEAASFTIAPTEAGHAKKMIVKSLTVTYELKRTYVSLLKSGWSVSACSSAPSEGGSSNGTGAAANLIDDNAGTYWHSNWSVCNESSRHFFEINLGESKTFDACSFMQRQDATGWNGAFQDVSIFVGSSSFGLTHDNIASFLESNTPVATVTLSSTDKSEQYLYFATPQTGQYVLVVPTMTVNPGQGASANNKYACLAEFSLYEKSSALTSANAVIARKKAEVLAGMEMFFGSKGLFLSAEQAELTELTAAVNNVAELTELTSISDVAGKVAQIESAMESVYNRLSGRMVYVVNARRQVLGQAPYLTVMENGNVNTIDYHSELGKWLLVRDGQTANFRLYSLEKDGYLAVNAVNADGQKFYFAANTYTDNIGLAMHYVDNGNGFNIDTRGNNLTTWSATDEGSSWVFELAGSMAEELTDGGYYRIRSNRGMYEDNGTFKTAGSLLGINTVVTDGATEGERQPVVLSKDGLGSIWQLKAVDGGFQAYNVAADFTGNDMPFALGARGDGSNKEPKQAYAKASDDAVTLVVFNAKGSGIGSYNGRIPYSLGVKTPALGSSCMDVANHGNGTPVLNEWNPESGEYNNGSIYYFEALAEEELNAMKAAYVAAAAGVDVPEFETAAAFYQGYEALFDDGFDAYNQTVNQLKEALENEMLSVTDVKSANSAFSANNAVAERYSAQLAEAAELLESQMPEIAAKANGRQVHFYNVQYPTYMLAAGAETMAVSTADTEVTTVWTLEQTEGFKYRLLNYGSGIYAGHFDRTDGSSNGSIPVPVASTADEAREYELVLFGNGQVGLQAGTGSYPLLHQDGEGRVVKWGSAATASKWTASMVDTDPVVIDYQKVDFGCTVSENVLNSIYFEAQSGSTLAISEGLGAHHTILVERFNPSDFPSQQDEAAMLAAEDESAPVPTHTYTITKDNLNVNGNRLEYVPDEAFEPGVLRMTAPMGFFTVDGKLSAPFTVHFTVASDGTTTGVDEISVADDADNVRWYTVQGVRVAAPSAAGVYVRVAAGKTSKVYVK